jgi:hypothetical protein
VIFEILMVEFVLAYDFVKLLVIPQLLPQGEAKWILDELDSAYNYMRVKYGEAFYKYGFLDGNTHDCFLR